MSTETGGMPGERLAADVVGRPVDRTDVVRRPVHGFRDGAGTDHPSFPVSTEMTQTPARIRWSPGNPVTPNRNLPPIAGIVKEEIRGYSAGEISELREDYARNGTRDAEYVYAPWEEGADAVILTDREMRRIRNVVEDSSPADALRRVLEISEGETHPPFDWATAARRLAFPVPGPVAFEADSMRETREEAAEIPRTLGILYFMYDATPGDTPCGSRYDSTIEENGNERSSTSREDAFVGTLTSMRDRSTCCRFL